MCVTTNSLIVVLDRKLFRVRGGIKIGVWGRGVGYWDWFGLELG